MNMHTYTHANIKTHLEHTYKETDCSANNTRKDADDSGYSTRMEFPRTGRIL